MNIRQIFFITALLFFCASPLFASTGECTTFSEPAVIKLNKPIYPKREKKLGITGTTELQIIIDSSGKILELKISKSSGNVNLDHAAIQAGRYSRFSPGKCENIDTGGRVIVSIVFS